MLFLRRFALNRPDLMLALVAAIAGAAVVAYLLVENLGATGGNNNLAAALLAPGLPHA
jgi:hypothetical protein